MIKQRFVVFKLVVIATLCTLLFVQCSNNNGHDSSDDNEVHPVTWIDPSQKGTIDYHGTYVDTNGTDSCKTCHGSSLQGTADISGCSNACHFGPEGEMSPPAINWQHPSTPHSNLIDQGEVCNKCHNIMRLYNLGPPSCHNCHVQNDKHPLGQSWLDSKSPEFHGISNIDCSDCHNLTKDCKECHFGASGSMAPTGSGWMHGNNQQHHNYQSDQNVCNNCHNLNRSYGNLPTDCHDCHDNIANHPLGQLWFDSKSDQFHGKSSLNCASCHDLSTECLQCHFGPNGSMTPAGSNWAHGLNDSHKTFQTNKDVCNMCHILDRSYGNPPASCHDCHEITANHPFGQPWLDSKNIQFHGKSDLDCKSCHDLTTDCAQCHFGATGSKAPPGSNWNHGFNDAHGNFSLNQDVCNKCHDVNRLYGNSPPDCHNCHGSGLKHPLGQVWLDPKSNQFHGESILNCASCHDLTADCTQCHFGASGSKVPDGSNWLHGYNDGHKNFEGFQGVCTKCHDLDRSYGNPPASCHDCHEIIKHPTGKTWLDPKSTQFHGDSSLTCSSCHNLNTDCGQCHFGSSGSKAPAGSGWNHGSNIQHHNFTADQDICNKCHSLNRSYGNPPASCHDCHEIVKHPTGKTWLDPKSTQFHGDSSLTCSSCHNLNTDCGQCHFGSSGSKAPASSGWNHGNNNQHRSYSAYQSVCNTCHNLNRSYGNPPRSCHDCHGDD
jgi:hypothetical protein